MKTILTDVEVRTKLPIRIQFVVGNTLQAECIVQGTIEADRVWAAWCMKKYDKKLPYGGASHSRADIKRAWDIPVGSTIYRNE
jgi:hypothetical protein